MALSMLYYNNGITASHFFSEVERENFDISGKILAQNDLCDYHRFRSYSTQLWICLKTNPI